MIDLAPLLRGLAGAVGSGRMAIFQLGVRISRRLGVLGLSPVLFLHGFLLLWPHGRLGSHWVWWLRNGRRACGSFELRPTAFCRTSRGGIRCSSPNFFRLPQEMKLGGGVGGARGALSQGGINRVIGDSPQSIALSTSETDLPQPWAKEE